MLREVYADPGGRLTLVDIKVVLMQPASQKNGTEDVVLRENVRVYGYARTDFRSYGGHERLVRGFTLRKYLGSKLFECNFEFRCDYYPYETAVRSPMPSTFDGYTSLLETTYLYFKASEPEESPLLADTVWLYQIQSQGIASQKYKNRICVLFRGTLELYERLICKNSKVLG